MLGHPTPPGPSTPAPELRCAVCPDNPHGHGTGFGAMNWAPPPNAAETPPWAWLSPRPRRVDTDAQAYLRVIHDFHRQMAIAPDVPFSRVRYGSR